MIIGLEIERGRYSNTPRDKRLCATCKQIDDEYHFFLYCSNNKQLRTILFDRIDKLYPNFSQNQPLLQLQQILNTRFELLPAVCDFIKQSLELRK